MFLCRDRVAQGRENLYRDRGFLCRDRVGHDRKLCRTDKAGRVKADEHKSVALCCVVKEEAMRSR